MKTFNFKTLLLAIGLVIASVQPTWAATHYLAGDFTNWGTNKLTFSDEKCSVYLSAGNHEFQVLDGDTWTGNSQGGTITRDNCTNWTFYVDGGNCPINADKNGYYTFYIHTWEDRGNGKWAPKVNVTYPDGAFHDLYVEYTKDGASGSWQKSEGDKDFSNVTSLIINRVYIKCWDNFGQNNTAWSKGGALGYKYNSHDYHISTGDPVKDKTVHWKGYDSSHPNNYEFFNESNANVNLISLVGGNSGKYTVEVWGKVNSTTNGWGDAYLKNGDNNFNWSFTILPPNVSNFGVTPSGAVAGTGTQLDPFIMPYKGTLTLTVNNLSQAHSDANSTLSLTGTGSNSKIPTKNGNVFTIGSIQNTNAYSVTISAKYVNNSDASLIGEESSVTYYYKMGQTSLTLEKNNNDASGSNNGSSNVNLGSKSFSPTAPTRTGYEPDGYYLENGCTTYVATAGGSLKSSISNYTDGEGKWIYTGTAATLYTKWEAKKYAISFDDQGATTAHTFTITEATYNESMPTFQSSKAPKKTGYTFQGYYTGTNGSGTKCYNTNGSSAYTWILTPTETTTLYAYWVPNVNTIVFNANTGSGDQMTNQTFTYGQAAKALSKNTYTKTGYHFIGWARTADGAVEYTDEQEITNITENTENVNLYAKWEANVTNITLYRNYNNEDVTTYELSASYDCTINQVTGLTSEIYTRTGYTHKGIYAASSGGSYLMKYDNSAWKFNSVANYCTATKWQYEAGGDLNLYSQWQANKYTITLNDNGGVGGSGSIQATYDSNTGIASGVTKPSNDPQIFAGYWTKNGTSDSDWGTQVIGNDGKFIINAGAGTYTDASGNWKYADAITLYAKWDAPAAYVVNFSVIDNASGTLTAVEKGSDPVEEITSGDEIDAGTVITLTFTPNDGTYKFGSNAIKGWKLDGWYSDVEHTQLLKDAAGSNSYDYTVPTNESSVYAYAPKVLNTFAIAVADGQSEMGSVNINQGTAGPAQYQEITANPTTPGYHFVNWTAGTIGNFAFVEGTTQTSASVKVAMKNEQNQTLIANFAETTVDIVPTVNQVGSVQGYTASASVSQIGIATTSVLTATTPLYGYKFTGWELSSNLVVTSGNKETDCIITVRTNGDGGAVTAQANYDEDLSSDWYLAGNGVFGGWNYEQAINMTKKAGESTVDKYYAEIEITTLKDDNFKLLDHSTSKYWTAEKHWVNRDYPHHDVEQKDGEGNHMIFKPDMVGTYKFMLDCTESKHRLTVTFPTSTTYDVDIYYDGVTKTTIEGGEFAKQITANVPQSMRFDQWVVEGETTHVNIADVNSQTTTFTASGEGAIIRAKFKVVGVMYLKASDVFGDAYVNFYSSKGYWDSDNSKGSGNSGNECMSKNNHMTKIGQTDIYYLDVSGGVSSWGWTQPFSFVNQNVNHENFSMCNVVYRSDYNDRLPLYVPRYGYITHYYINCHYYNDGIWMKYNDTYSGYKLHIIETGSSENDYEFNAETPGGYEFKTTVSLKTGVTYKFKIVNENNTWYGASGQTMTATSCTNWKMHLDNDDCQITTSEAGNYTFILNLGSGEVIVSVEYPLSASDYRVVAKKDSEDKWVGDLIKHSDVAKNDTTSFYNNNYTYQLQQYAGGDTWNDVAGQTVTITDKNAEVGVITLIVTQDGSNQATLAYEGIYTGNYYIRTDGVDGGWGDYEHNSDNKMDNYGSLIDADPTYQYDVYKAKWVLSGKNVKFRIANDYSKAISDELLGDAIIGNDKETLPQEANVRFMWNSETNELKRAYLSGSSNPSDRYLILEGDAKMFDKDGKILTDVPQGGTASDYAKVDGLGDYELNFEDKNNWVYQADIQAQPGCAVKLTAKYNGKVQYFIGKEGTETDSRRKIIDGEGTGMYNLRAVYDFKTNRLVAGWIPSGTITGNIILGSDMLIERTEQGDASQIVFGGDKQSDISISEIQHIYGVLKLTKETMTSGTKTDYEKSIYWISFPFDVKVSEIFGVEKYGEVWVISNYRGDLRAQKGWFKEDTPTFWEYLKPTDIMKANVGYTLNLDPDYFNKETSEPWKSGASEVAWYFPSMQENIGVVSLAQKDTTLPAQHCTIDREFNAGTDDAPRMVNHKFTDSNWRVIGVPAFQNLQAPTFDPAPVTNPDDDGKKNFGLTGFYEWQPSTNTYTAHTTDGYTFKATNAYMVQYAGKITWSDASAITTNKAPWHASADSKSYSIKLEFGNEAYTDQTFVTLTEKASTDFVLNEDMMKLDNAGFPNIYSFAGNYNVAYNETKMDNQTVTLGVSAPKAGTYTFAMPNQFSGTAKLIDLVEGITTDLNVSNYSVDLNKGTYNDRFQLLLEVEAKAPTSMENVDGGWWSVDGKTLKLLRNGNIYLINAGRVYNATGAELR